MLSNANFIGNANGNIVVIPQEYGGTTIQALEETASEGSGVRYNVAQVQLYPNDIYNLITALVMTYNDLPEQTRDSTKVELTRVLEVKTLTSQEPV